MFQVLHLLTGENTCIGGNCKILDNDFHPIETETRKFPVVILSNGIGVRASKYAAILKHLASWGFIVIGTEEEYSWNGFSSETSLTDCKWPAHVGQQPD